MNANEEKTFKAAKTILNDSVEVTLHMVRAKADPDYDERDAADFPLINAGYLAALPERARPAVRAAAGRLRAIAKDGNFGQARAKVAEEASALVDVLPRGWTLPAEDPAALAARIPR